MADTGRLACRHCIDTASIPERYWIPIRIWLAFGTALTIVISDLPQQELAAQIRNFRG